MVFIHDRADLGVAERAPFTPKMLFQVNHDGAPLNTGLGKLFYSELEGATVIGPTIFVVQQDFNDILAAFVAVVVANILLTAASCVKGSAVVSEAVPLCGMLQINNRHVVRRDIVNSRRDAGHTKIEERHLAASHWISAYFGRATSRR